MSNHPFSRSVARREFRRAYDLHFQEKYSEAETLFRKVAHENERNLGNEHQDTLDSIYCLGSTLYMQKRYGEAEGLFRQAVKGRERILGKDDQDTLDSICWLGSTLYMQKRYGEAEGLFRQAVEAQERILGKDNQDTLYSKYSLGRTLYGQDLYSEAEGLFRQAVKGQERILGKDNQDTLYSKYSLGRTLYGQDRYSEAEGLFRQAVKGQERILGKDNQDTLYSKYLLGCTLYKQKRYSEAEGLFRQAVKSLERICGKEDRTTLNSIYWLGRTLYEQERYSEAEGLLRQAVKSQERICGEEDRTTLNSIYWLGRTLYEQERYSEAEGLLRQAVKSQERIYSKEDKATLYSIFWLGRTLCMQRRDREAEELLQQAANGWHRTGGGDDLMTLSAVEWLHKVHRARSPLSPTSDSSQHALADRPKAPPPLPTSTSAQQVLPSRLKSSPPLPNISVQRSVASRLSGFFSEGQSRRAPYTDSQITEVSTLLQHSDPRWIKVPRTYIVLRTIGHLNLLQDFIDVGFSDYWFPVTERGLPGCLRPNARTAFFSAQRLVLTTSIDLEKGEKGQHCYFKEGESPPLEPKEVLGNGGYGQVDKVLSLISFKEYARKRVPRSTAFRGRRKEGMTQFIAEIEILKRLKHHHIVEFVGSYTDFKYVGLIMSPVAEMDLGTYLSCAAIAKHPELRTFFGCLAETLRFLHEQKIRHKDIKPGNILVNHGRVLFTDFGLSLDFQDANASTTVGMVNGMTPRYCAPEVLGYEPRNTKSDIWSLGVVFLEMIVVLKGQTIQDMDEFFKRRGSQSTSPSKNIDVVPEFIVQLESIGSSSDNTALGWAQGMLSPDQHLRPTAYSLVEAITAMRETGESTGFCGICCVDLEDDFSDT